MEPGRDRSDLEGLERQIVALMRAANETRTGKELQGQWLKHAVHPFVRNMVARRTFYDGTDWMRGWKPDRGVILAANHRSFFDQFVLMLPLWGNGALKFFEHIYFPVRANYFYEKPAGALINLLLGGGALYPPIFRDRDRAHLNQTSLDKIVELLRDPKTLVGVHPEGTRGKGADPYRLLPARPGIGRMILQSHPIVIPAFINGLSNDLGETIRTTFSRNARRQTPIICVFGKPFDYSEFTQSKPRASLYKKCADRLLETIGALSKREQEIRRDCAAGLVSPRDPRWLTPAR